MKKEKCLKIKVFSSKFLMAGIITMLILCYSIFILVNVYQPARVQILIQPLLYVILIVFTLCFPTLAAIFSVRQWATVYILDKKGINSSVLHFFIKKNISWESVTEIIYIERLLPYLCITDGESIENLEYAEIIKRKDIFQIKLNTKVYQTIKYYSKLSIKGLTEEKIKSLKL